MPTELASYPSLKGKSVFVTGGGSGIGAAIVQGMARNGAQVAFVDIQDGPSEALVADIEAKGWVKPLFIHCDITDIPALTAAIQQARAAHGPVTALVNNAANDDRHDFDDVTPEYWSERQDLLLRPMFFTAQAVAPQMREAGGGSIVNFGSISWMAKMDAMPAYTSAKAAVHGLTRSLASRLGPDRIRVNTVVPGWVMTERQKALWLDDDGERQMDENQCLPGRVQPEDLANMVLFLCADDSHMCSAQDYIVDAGWI